MVSQKMFLVLLLTVVTFFACNAEQPKTKTQVNHTQSASNTVKKDSATTTTQTPVLTPTSIVVYYFLTNDRCPTCYKLERLARSVVETDFAEAIKTGTVQWKAINVDDAGNEHFINDYKLYTKAVIVSQQKNGKELFFKNLDKIWQHIANETAYREYLRSEIRACLIGKCL